MAWDEQAAERAAQWLKSGSVPQCRCGSAAFALDERLAAVPTVPRGDGLLQIQVGPVFGCVVVTCAKCHEMRLYNAQSLGLI